MLPHTHTHTPHHTHTHRVSHYNFSFVHSSNSFADINPRKIYGPKGPTSNEYFGDPFNKRSPNGTTDTKHLIAIEPNVKHQTKL